MSATGSNLGIAIGVLIVLLTAFAFGGHNLALFTVVVGVVLVTFAALELYGFGNHGHH